MSYRRLRSALPALLLVSVLGLAGCSAGPKPGVTPSADDVDDNNDPYESFNRTMFDVNLTLDKYFFKPVAQAYRWAVPHEIRGGISNVLANLKSPLVFANDLAQGNVGRATETFMRTTINSTVGLGGIFDVAGATKLPAHDSDFGQTLGVWGVPPGPYLVLPLLGPSDPRDAIGYGVDSVVDPFTYEMRRLHIVEASDVRLGMTLISERTDNLDTIDDLQRNSLDFYAALRSLYQQKRASDVQTGKHPPSLPANP